MQDKFDEIQRAAEGGVPSLWRQRCLEGAAFFVDGEEMSPAAAISRTVQEDGAYMADFVLGEAGRVEQVRFDRVQS